MELPSGAYADYSYFYDNAGPGDRYPEWLILNRPVQKQLHYNKEYDGSTTAETETWLYTPIAAYNALPNLSGITVTGPDGGTYTENYAFDSTVTGTNIPEHVKGEIYKSVGADGSISEKYYTSNAPLNAYQSNGNRFVKYDFTSPKDASGNFTKTAITEHKYDKNGNQTEIREYDFVTYSTVPRNSAGEPTGLPSGAVPARITKTEYYNDTPDSASGIYNDPDSYWLANSPRLRSLPKSVEVQDGSQTPKSRSEISYDYTAYASNTLGGNPVQTNVWDSFKGGASRAYSNPLTTTNSISTSVTYNSYGMLLTTTDANGTVSQITYGNVSGPSGNVTDLYPTQTISAYGTSIARTSTAVYDFYTGIVTTATDVDNNVSVVTEYDALGRPKKVRTAAGTSLESWTRTEYDDVNRRVIVRADLETIGDGKKVATQFYDQLGRVRLSKTLENAATQDAYNETHGIKVQTRYQTGNPNSYQLTSNPFRVATASTATNEQTMGWTRSKSVNTGRHSEVETFSGAALPAPWGSNSSSTGKVQTDVDTNATTVTDQALKQRRSITNALGQLIRVDEPNDAGQLGTVASPNQPTNYSYDTLNNLTAVNQGVQTRSFQYDSLSRLKNAANPESGLIQYGYDNNGNVTGKTDARGVATAYVYDALNRVTNRNYTAPANLPNYQATPNVSYFYDNVANAKGKLTKVASSVSTTEYVTFDILGRVTRSKQTTDGVVYGTDANPMTYTYNLSGALIEQKYPSGRTAKNILDNNGNLAQVQSQKSPADIYRNYANSFVYTAAGAVSSLRLGNGKFETTQFNSRLQPTQIGLGASASSTNLLKLDYSYGTTQNNGNVQSQTITVPTVGSNPGFTAVQNYTYDSLNRLKDADEKPSGYTQTQCDQNPGSCWKQTFLYDRYGNRNFDTTANRTTTIQSGCAVAVCNPAVDPTTNKLVGYQFDNSGNTKVDANGQTFIYDSENKQAQVSNASGVIGNYFYDGDGKRVKKYVPSTGETTIFVYDAAGNEIAEYSTIVEGSSAAKVNYLTNDHLGSPRINTDAVGNVTSRHDYHPFGEEIASSQRNSNPSYAPDKVRKQFSQSERDDETGLQSFGARYYSSSTGRFVSADPLLSSAKAGIPQSWNRYVYTQNNPITLVDILGLYTFGEGATGDSTEAEDRRNLIRKYHQGIKDALSYYKNKDASKYAKQIGRLEKVLAVLGEEGKKGSAGIDVKITFTNTPDDRIAEAGSDLAVSGSKVSGINYRINFDPRKLSQTDESSLAHEGQHVADLVDLFKTGSFRNGRVIFASSVDLQRGTRELRGLEIQQFVLVANGKTDPQSSESGGSLYSPAWASVDEKTFEANLTGARAVALLHRYYYTQGATGKWYGGESANTYAKEFNRSIQRR